MGHELLQRPHVFERDDKLFIVTPVAPFDPAPSEIEEFAFSNAIKQHASNKNLVWYQGQYVEADNANENGALWTENELAIASITPNFMPVTVMHDPRTAVGLIADTRLLLKGKANVPRSRLDNTIAVWGHRFPEVVEEAAANYRQGTLMQSMECLPTHYDCTACGKRYPKLPGGAEKAMWCEHLRAATETAARRLGGVTFTGTGLIFGTRGATGAFTEAHLETFQDEVAEAHQRSHTDSRRTTPRRKRTMEIEDREYQQLLAERAELERMKADLASAQETAAKVPDLEKKIEETEAAKVQAESERDTLKTEKAQLEESARADKLAGDRMGGLGKGFKEKLGDFTRGRLEEQAKSLSDEDWDARLKELEEVASVKRDEGGTEGTEGGGGGGDGTGTMTREETARLAGGNGGNNGGSGSAPSRQATRSVVAGLVKRVQTS